MKQFYGCRVLGEVMSGMQSVCMEKMEVTFGEQALPSIWPSMGHVWHTIVSSYDAVILRSLHIKCVRMGVWVR